MTKHSANSLEECCWCDGPWLQKRKPSPFSLYRPDYRGNGNTDGHEYRLSVFLLRQSLNTAWILCKFVILQTGDTVTGVSAELCDTRSHPKKIYAYLQFFALKIRYADCAVSHISSWQKYLTYSDFTIIRLRRWFCCRKQKCGICGNLDNFHHSIQVGGVLSWVHNSTPRVWTLRNNSQW